MSAQYSVYSRRRVRAVLLGTSAIAMLLGASTAVRAQASSQTLDPITVLATKTEEKASESLSAVSTLRQEQFDQIAPKRLSDLLYGIPGVWVQERGDSPETAINIRGMQDFGRVAVVVDGARQNFQRSGHNANGTFFLEPELLAGVDIVRGPVANIYGSGAIGGVASFTTKDVKDVLRPGERWGGLAHVMVGSNQGQMLGSYFGAARIGANVDALAGFTYRDKSNYKDGHGTLVPNSGFDVASGMAKVTVRPMDGHEVKLTGITSDNNYITGQRAAVNNESEYDTNVKNNIVSARWKYARPEDRLFDFDGSVYWTNTQQNQTKISGTTTPITGRIGDKRSFGIDTVGFDLNNTTRFDAGGLRHAFTYGGDWFTDKVENVDPTGAGAVLTPTGERTVGGAFGQWKVNYATWFEFIGALRYDSYNLDGGNTSASGDHISPKTTIGITPLRGVTFYGTYAEGYRAPAVTETLVSGAHPPFAVGFPGLFTFLPNPSLRPETGKTKEFGVNLQQDGIFSAGDRLRGKFNVYRNDVSDYIELVNFGSPVNFTFCPAPFPGCPPVPNVTIPINTFSLAQYQNLASARIEGVELETTYDAGTWFASVAGQASRGKNVENGNPLASVPPNKVAVSLGVRMLDDKLTAMVRWVGVEAKKADDIPDSDGNGVPDFSPTSGYGLVNVSLGYEPTPDVLVSLGVDNIFDRYYVPYLSESSSSAFAGPGVAIKGGVKIRFGSS